MRMIVGLMALAAVTSPAMARKHHGARAKVKPAKIVAAPAPVADVVPPATPANLWHLDLSTGGAVIVQLRPDKAPNHIARIQQLTRARFYDGLLFHRVIEGFMAQTGDPKGTGEGGSPLPDLKAEFNDLPHVRGTVSMARATQPDSANSQFFIVLMPTLRLDGNYTAFGRVLSGMNFVDAIEKGEPPVNPSKIVHAWIEADGPNAAKVPLPAASLTAPVAPTAPAPATPTQATGPQPTEPAPQ